MASYLYQIFTTPILPDHQMVFETVSGSKIAIKGLFSHSLSDIFANLITAHASDGYAELLERNRFLAAENSKLQENIVLQKKYIAKLEWKVKAAERGIWLAIFPFREALGLFLVGGLAVTYVVGGLVEITPTILEIAGVILPPR